ncbi:CTTNBP2 N-terminal-like protein [Daktulosphaira vitifoliae]|uniref:CTTNBP2 N-terminal-like protein n=1 Tax=Daktulosphaira vitifoliae TaxID=58002 RepID=UPI0021AA9549|nr:CTTNBP2 N-terminal-like protein [Daktulosphaira vitifoliae]
MTTKDENVIMNCCNDDRAGHGDSNTVKKTPKVDLNKSDLLKLLSYLEGELQARDVVIATLKCEKIKSMLKNRGTDCLHKDPLAALQRDCFATFDTNNDDDSLSYRQLGSLENLVLQQRKTHLRIANVLKDNQVMHRKILELERLKKQQLEYEFKKLQRALQEERVKHKQMVFFLLAERKKIVMKYIEERKRSEDLGQILSEEKSKIDLMAEGLEEESKKSLQMEADLEKNLVLFENETKKLVAALSVQEERSRTLELELTKCRSEIASLEKELSEALQDNLPEPSNRSSSVSSSRIVVSAPSGDPIMSSVAKVVQPTATASSVRVCGPMTGIARSVTPGQSLRCTTAGGGPINECRVDISPNANDASSPGGGGGGGTMKKQTTIPFARSTQSMDVVGTPPTSTAIKKLPFALQRNVSVPNVLVSDTAGKKPLQAALGRGTPPPVPPNKPAVPPKRDLGSIKKWQQSSAAENNAVVASANDRDPKESAAAAVILKADNNIAAPKEITAAAAPVDDRQDRE